MHASGEIDAAYEAFQTCLQHDPTFSDAVMNLVAAGKKTGRTDEAIIALQRLLAIVPSNDEARAALTELEATAAPATRLQSQVRMTLHSKRRR